MDTHGLETLLAISLFLTHRKEFIAIASIAAVAVVAILLTILPRILARSVLDAIIRQGRRATSQTTLRWSIVLLLVLLVAAARFGLDVVLGAMLAGMVLRSGHLPRAAAGGPRPALTPGLPARPAAAPAGRDDVHHRDHHAPADRAG
jgi:predicted Kef-type K+ transport protein